jgi:hypothetical protein
MLNLRQILASVPLARCLWEVVSTRNTLSRRAAAYAVGGMASLAARRDSVPSTEFFNVQERVCELQEKLLSLRQIVNSA